MYMSLGRPAPASSPDCPSQDDANLVSLAQMAFVSVTVSVFTLVASISNNLNANNNNDNSNNLNLASQKDTSLSQNQNIVNTINIDLPPPVPGRRKRHAELEERLRDRLARCSEEGEVYRAVMALLKANVEVRDQRANRQCVARQICANLAAGSPRQGGGLGGLGGLLFHFQLLYLGLDDRSAEFKRYLRGRREEHNGAAPSAEQCFQMFPECGMQPDFEMRRAPETSFH